MHKLIAALGILAAATATATATTASAQHHQHGHQPQQAAASPYAGQQDRSIKSLSDQEAADLLAGQGMGLAKAAELNGYPGPAHVLENAAALGLSSEQRSASDALMRKHKAAAREIGKELVAAERGLDTAFAHKTIDAALLARLTREIGLKQAQLREEHLRTHLEQTALLTPEQVGRYAQLRGYAAAPAIQPAAATASQPKHH